MSEVLELQTPPTPLVRGAKSELATVALVGLGYVGLPVAVAFGRVRTCIGYDLSSKRIQNLLQHVDATGEVTTAELMQAKHLKATSDPAEALAGSRLRFLRPGQRVRLETTGSGATLRVVGLQILTLS